MKYWKLTILLLIAVLLCGCEKTEKVENGSEFARLGKAEDEPDSRTTNIYEEIGS